MKYFLFPKTIKIYFKKLYGEINASILGSQRQIKTFGIIFFINYPVYYLIWKFGSVQGYENLSLRISASLLCVPLIFYDKWYNKFKKYFPIYWYFTVTYCLPFFFLYMTLQNHGSVAWLLNLLLEIMLTFLLFDLASVITVNAAGFSLAWLIYNFIEGNEIVFDPSTIDVFGAIGTIVATFVVGSIFAHNNEKIKNEKLRAISMIGESIAHELRTPLNTIQSGANGLKKYLPSLIETYKVAKEKNLKIPEISVMHYSTLVRVLDNITSEVQSAYTFINMLLVNANESSGERAYQTFSISHCIDEAISRYPFDLKERELFHWDKRNDFYFVGDKDLIIHVIFNLIRNSLYYIKAASKGEIFISTEQDRTFNVLHFKDTGKGIAKKTLPYIFDRFYSKTYHGTGIGLAFCKLVMKNFGGSISCESIENEYVTFRLKFPKSPGLQSNLNDHITKEDK